MSFVEGNGGLSAADIAAVTNGNGGFGWGGDGAWWLIILFLFAMNGNGFGWGNNGGGGASMQRGFDQQAVMSQLGAITANLGNAEVNAANRQMAIDTHLDSIAMALQNCCCENRAAVADLKYTVASEACNTRQAVAQGNQQILDKLCQLELDGIKQNYENRISGMQNTIDQLRSQLNSANFTASQTAQTSRILADNAAQTVALEQYLNPTPVPAYVVQNPNCCYNNNYSCGCMQ